MLAYLRTILHKRFFETEQLNTLPLSEVTNLDFEVHIMEFYLEMLYFIESKFITTLAEDESLLEQGADKPKMSFEMRMAILFRRE